MCGRFSLSLQSDHVQSILVDVFGKDLLHSFNQETPRYNIAPSQSVWSVIFDGSHYRVGQLSWGLIPSFATEKNIAFQMINAKTETIFNKPAFSRSILTSRCLILADGFYEWQDRMGKKIPHYIALKDGELFAFAGIYSKNTRIQEHAIYSTAILTKASEGAMETIHSRAPIMLTRSYWKSYLQSDLSPTTLQSIFDSPLEPLTLKPVSTYVNKPGHEGPQCLNPYESTSLF